MRMGLELATTNTDVVSGVPAPTDIPVRVSIVMPCLNEATTITQCVGRAFQVLSDSALDGEVLVVDNGSADGSDLLASESGATVIRERRRGYGNAYRAGFLAARGDYIVMVDADLTYDLASIPQFIAELDRGADVVVGDRMNNIHPGAMSWSHRYIGNPFLSGLLNAMFHTGVSDAHCGMRAFRRDVLERLDLRTTGMEFASEMVIRAAKEDLVVRQFAIEYFPRGGQSKLSSFRDGWRHLRFLLVHSPRHLFLWPGGVLTALGILVQTIVLAHVGVFGRFWDVHATIGGAVLIVIGVQVMALGACARTYAAYFLGERDAWFSLMRSRLRLEHGLLAGASLAVVGIGLESWIVVDWISNRLGSLGQQNLAVAAATMIIVGVQLFFTSFLLSVLGLRRAP